MHACCSRHDAQVSLLSAQVVEMSARYDDACYPGTTTDAEREALLMQARIQKGGNLMIPPSYPPAGLYWMSAISQAYADPTTEEQALTCGAPPTLVVPKRMKAPIFIYYQLDNFHQNHRR